MGYIDMMNHHSARKAGKNAMRGLREETRHDHSEVRGTGRDINISYHLYLGSKNGYR